ncbi:MAG TPA: ATP-binding protein [Thermoanaerobacterium sp.]|nr:ATP-binding protein [Thermoanaerobacterium sp.]
MFVNRKTELNWLEEAYGSGCAGLLVLYGRRRVGKTELLRVFCRGKRHVFFVADLAPDREHLAAFSQRLWEQACGQPSWWASASGGQNR